MSAFLLAEAWRITGQCLWKLVFCKHSINEFSNHGMLACSDQIQVFSFNLIHHGIHFGKTHNTGNYIAADHEWRNTVSKSAANHKVAGIRQHSRMKPCNISHQIVKAISRNSSSTLKIDSIKTFHDFCMVWNLEIWYHRLAKLLYFNIFAVVFSNWYGRINDIWNCHHDLLNLCFNFLFFCGKEFYSVSILLNLLL